MQASLYAEIAARAYVVLSVDPPKDAYAVAEALAKACKVPAPRELVFAEMNAVSPQSIKKMASLFEGTRVRFVDGGIVGGPPSETYNPALYLSADERDGEALDRCTAFLKEHGLNPFPLKGDGAGVGDASALKMAHAGIVKGVTALFSIMVLSAHDASPATATGLLHALDLSQPALIGRMVALVPQMLPKAYRFVFEMDEIAEFIGGEEGATFHGIEKIFTRIAKAHEGSQAGTSGDCEVLLKVVEEAKRLGDRNASKDLY